MKNRRWIGGCLVVALAAGSAMVEAQATNGEEPGPAATDLRAAPTPFGPGERLEYQVKLGVLSVGDGHMAVEALDSVRGFPTYHVSMGIEGGLLFAKVNDTFESWIDVRSLVSRRFIQDQDEVNYERFRQFEFYPEERRFERADTDEEGELPTSFPLDDISFVYFARTLPLEVGKEFTFHRYFKEDGNPVVLKVLRKDRVEVPAGTFNTIVVQPIIKTDGLFGEGGEAEIHFTDDDRRLLVYMQSKVPVMGNLSLHLRSIEEGTPLNPLGATSANGAGAPAGPTLGGATTDTSAPERGSSGGPAPRPDPVLPSGGEEARASRGPSTPQAPGE